MPQEMDRYKVLAVRRPGQKGTKTLVKKYGSRLRCVRYVYDKLTDQPFKTVELIEVGSSWIPSDLPPYELVGVHIGLHEVELRAKVRRAGGRWDHYDRVWIVRYKDLEALGMKDRSIMIREIPAKYEV